ncbi:hypothetical protein JCM3775_002257 [Rhodotorula graminis]
MQRFADLPPELVARIIELSASPLDPADPLEARRGRRLLDSLSLVHSTWTPVAQRLLLAQDRVSLYHRREYDPFAKLARYPLAKLPRLVKRLDLELWGDDQDDDLAAVLRECDSLDELVLTYVERVHLDQVAVGSNLAALSFRQCTLVSTFHPLLEPPPDLPLPPPPSFAALTSLDLRLCSLRRDFLPFSAHPDCRPLPHLQHLLLHTGSHDQSPSSIRAFVRSVAAGLRSLSLDATAEDILFPRNDERDSSAPPGPAFPSLRTAGLYWDAAWSRLVGTHFVLGAGEGEGVGEGARARAPPPPYLHIALYPAGLDALRATLLSLFESAELRAGMRWRAVEHVRAEGTLRDLDGHDEQDDDEREEQVQSEDDEEEDELDVGASERATATGRPTAALLDAAKDAGVDFLIEQPSSCSDDPGAVEIQRATFARGFGTSWWRFVREVERDEVRRAAA